MSMLVSVVFLLAAPGQAGAPATVPSVKTADAGDKLICKRFAETGSLVRGVKMCKTRADWQRERDEMREGMSHGNGCGDTTKGC